MLILINIENILFKLNNIYIFIENKRFILLKETIHNDYSNHINEIIEKKPNWLIRFGIGSILFILILFLFAAWLVKYPDIIVGKVEITTPKPPIEVVSKINATIEIKNEFAENDTIHKNNTIILLENNSSYKQIKKLQSELSAINYTEVSNQNFSWLDSLGTLQSFYNNYIVSKINFNNYLQEQPYQKRISASKNILSGNKKNVSLSANYLNTSLKDFESKQKEHDRYKKLYNKGVISASEYEGIKQNILQKEMSFTNDHKNINSEKLSLANLEREILELELQEKEYYVQLKNNYLQTGNELKNQLKLWESQYILSSPIDGTLSYFNELNEGDFITSGERIFTVIPFQQKKLQAIGVFPAENAGKVKKGNKVILKLDAYPYHEYGTIEGVVKRISEIPKENMYSITIDMPNNLKTNYEKKIIFKQRLSATADIITKDQSVLQRIFYQFENLFKN